MITEPPHLMAGPGIKLNYVMLQRICIVQWEHLCLNSVTLVITKIPLRQVIAKSVQQDPFA